MECVVDMFLQLAFGIFLWNCECFKVKIFNVYYARVQLLNLFFKKLEFQILVVVGIWGWVGFKVQDIVTTHGQSSF
jgi:hypothetical protein